MGYLVNDNATEANRRACQTDETRRLTATGRCQVMPVVPSHPRTGYRTVYLMDMHLLDPE